MAFTDIRDKSGENINFANLKISGGCILWHKSWKIENQVYGLESQKLGRNSKKKTKTLPRSVAPPLWLHHHLSESLIQLSHMNTITKGFSFRLNIDDLNLPLNLLKN